MLRPNFTSRFRKDVKQLKKKHVDIAPLEQVMQLIVENTPETKDELKRRHNMHLLRGEWKGSYECHIANAGDWLLIWATTSTEAYFQRTGTHDDLFAS